MSARAEGDAATASTSNGHAHPRAALVLTAVLAMLASMLVATVTTAAAPASAVALMPTLAGSQVSAGKTHTCAAGLDGEAYCWGEGSAGELGNGLTLDSTKPVTVRKLPSGGEIPNAAGITQVATGDVHSCAVTSTGGLYCWGSGSRGQLGSGSTANQIFPMAVARGGSSALPVDAVVTGVSASGFTTCAVTQAGGLYCWGANTSGMLGVGANGGDYSSPQAVSRTSPSALASGALVTGVSVGGSHTCAVTSTGLSYCWGLNTNGRVGDGTGSGVKNTPVAVARVGTGASALPVNAVVSEISAGSDQSCAITSAFAIYCWGANAKGQIGLGTTSASVVVPTAVVRTGALGNVGVKHVTAGASYTCASTVTGPMYCWGANASGQLGDDSVTASSLSVAVTVGGSSSMPSGAAMDSISAGGGQSCAVTTGATSHAVFCWGLNSSGQVGNATAIGPVKVPAQAVIPMPLTTDPEYGLSFPSTAVSATSTQQVQVYNNTNTAIPIGAATITGTDSSMFAASSTGTGNCINGESPPGFSCFVNVTFTPTAIGSRTATLNLALTSGSVQLSLSGTGTGQPALTPTFAAAVSNQTGFTAQVSNYDAAWGWAVQATAGTAAINGSGLVTVTGLTSGQSSTVTVTTTRSGYTSGSAPLTASADAQPARTPAFGTPSVNPTGFTAQITNYDAAWGWSAQATAGTAVINGSGLVTVTGMTTTQSSTVTVTTTRAGYNTGAGTVTAIAATGTALTPAFGQANSYEGGFNFPITNYDAAFGWSVTSTAGTPRIQTPVGNVATVTVDDLALNQQATVTVNTTRSGYTSGSAQKTASGAPGVPIYPLFDTPVGQAGGFTVNVTNYAPGWTWSAQTLSFGTASISDTGVVTVTGLNSAQAVYVAVTATKTNYGLGTTNVLGQALSDALTPTLGPAEPNATGFGIPITNYNSSWTWTATSTAGTVTVEPGVAVAYAQVAGLTVDQSATVTVTASRAEYAPGSATATGTAAYGTALNPTFGSVSAQSTGFTVPVTNYSPVWVWTLSSSAGTATLTSGVITVTGLTVGQSATVTANTARVGYTAGTAQVTGTAGAPPSPTPVKPLPPALAAACPTGSCVGANLFGIDLRGVDLTGVDLSGANLSSANLNGVKLSGANLSGANLSSASMIGVSLVGANLSNAVLAGADMRKSNLKDVDLRGANLAWANLSSASIVDADMRGANFYGAVATYSNFYNCNVQNANMTKMNLRGSTFVAPYGYGRSTARASGKKMKMNKVNLKGANLYGTRFVNVSMKATVLKKASLKFATLRDVNLTDADLRKANLSNANFVRVNMTDTKVKHATVSTATFKKTAFPWGEL